MNTHSLDAVIDRLNTVIAEYGKLKIKSDMKDIKIYLKSGKVIDFVGVYRRDLEKGNWHYYEINTGDIIHCRKENMECVEEHDIYVKDMDKGLMLCLKFQGN